MLPSTVKFMLLILLALLAGCDGQDELHSRVYRCPEHHNGTCVASALEYVGEVKLALSADRQQVVMWKVADEQGRKLAPIQMPIAAGCTVVSLRIWNCVEETERYSIWARIDNERWRRRQTFDSVDMVDDWVGFSGLDYWLLKWRFMQVPSPQAAGFAVAR